MTRAAQDPEAALERRIEVARQSGVPEEPLRAYAESRRGQGFGISRLIEPDRPLLPGVEIETDLGTWQVYETPGHAPSHVCMFQPEHRLLISGDHLLGRVSPFFDYGYSPDPAGEFLNSLGVIEKLDARLCLSGHGRTFTDVQGHIDGNRALVHERIEKVYFVISRAETTVYDAVPQVYGQAITPMNANWWMSETLCYLTHLEREGRAERIPGEPERWRSL
jgi:glyoxylase-like metal-dependent hydrolase (beta-lactamase superfamily II)